MKYIVRTAVISLSLFTSVSCKRSQTDQTDTSAADSSNLGLAEGEYFVFDLAGYISKKQGSSVLAPYAKTGALILGSKASLAVENNFTVKGSQPKRSVTANYYLKAHAFKKAVPVVDATATVFQSPLSGTYKISAFGQTVKTAKITSEFNYKSTRDYTIAIPGAALSAIGFYGKAGVGGEVSIRGVPAWDPKRGSVQLRMNPSAKLYSKLELGASVLAGIGKASVLGTVRLFEVEEPVYSEMGVNASKQTWGQFKANAVEVNGLGGTLAGTVTIGVNSKLPPSMQGYWKKYLEKQWKWEVLNIPVKTGGAIQGTDAAFGKR